MRKISPSYLKLCLLAAVCLWLIASTPLRPAQAASYPLSAFNPTTPGELDFACGSAAQVVPLSSSFLDRDVGAVGLAGGVSYGSGTMTLAGSGWDIWERSDAFNYAYRTLDGDGEIVARIPNQTRTDAWAKAGVMMREDLSPSARHASMFVTPGNGAGFQRRAAAGSYSSLTLAVTSGNWLKLVRSGSTFSGYVSTDGARWTLVGTETISMGASVYVGLAVTSHNNAALNTTTFDNISLNGVATGAVPTPTPTPTPKPTATPTPTPTPSTSPVPRPWADGDIGIVGSAGGANYAGGTFNVKGSGADIWEMADAFHYVYQPLDGDGQIVARVASQQNTNAWAKAGVMIREDLSPSARHASVFLTPTNGSGLQYRVGTGGASVLTLGAKLSAPSWVKLVRAGSNFYGYTSADGVNWTLAGMQTIQMSAGVYVGLAVTSHSYGTLGTVVFSDVNLTAAATPAPTPTATPKPTPTPTPTPNAATQFYVSPYGTSFGDGSKANPWDLATALAQPAAVKPGATVWLRGGFYYGAFTSGLTGTQAAPVTLRAYPGERAVIDGNGYDGNPLTVNGAWAVYWGFEVMNSNPDRSKARAGAVNVFGAHTKFINMVVHDACEGFGFWTSAVDAELYGNIIYNGGWQGASPDRGHGHGVYAQNDAGTKLVRDNVIFNQYGYGFHAYTQGGKIDGFTLEGNVIFNNGQPTRERYREPNILVGGYVPASRIALRNNYTWQPLGTYAVNVQLHYSATNNQDVAVENNYFANGIWPLDVRDWQKVTFTGNTITGKDVLFGLYLPQGVNTSAYAWDGNAYYQVETPTVVSNLGGVQRSFADWQKASGLDRNSRFTQGPPPTQVFVRPNQYEQGRAHIVIYNSELRQYVDADVSGVLAVGERYEVRNVQDYFAAPVLSGTYDGSPLHLPMYGLSVAQPVGSSGLQPTGPSFNVFVLVRLP